MKPNGTEQALIDQEREIAALKARCQKAEAQIVYIVKTLDPHDDFDASPVEAIARGVMRILDNTEAERDKLLASAERYAVAMHEVLDVYDDPTPGVINIHWAVGVLRAALTPSTDAAGS